MHAIFEQKLISDLDVRSKNEALGEKIGLIGKIFGCWHKELSRPFTEQSISYRVCLQCGARKAFDAQNFKTFGPFYYPPAISLEVKS